GPVRACPPGLASAVGPDDEDRGWIRQQRAVLRRQARTGAGREPSVRLRDPVRERHVAEQAPDDEEDEEPDDAERDPETPATSSRRFRGRHGCAVGAGPPIEGYLAL